MAQNLFPDDLAKEAQIGEVQDNPTQYTVLERLKVLKTALDSLAGGGSTQDVVDAIEVFEATFISEDFATQATLEAARALLEQIEANTDELEIKIDNVDVNTDELEAKLDDIKACIDLFKTAFDDRDLATEAKQDDLIAEVNALQGTGDKTLTNIDDRLGQVRAELIDMKSRRNDTYEQFSYGVAPLGIRNDSLISLGGDNLDYHPMSVDEYGRQIVSDDQSHNKLDDINQAISDLNDDVGGTGSPAAYGDGDVIGVLKAVRDVLILVDAQQTDGTQKLRFGIVILGPLM